MYIAILGRQPELGLAELESLLGAPALSPIATVLCLIDAQNIPYERFGSVMKFAQVQDTLQNVQSNSLEQQLFSYIQDAHPYEDGVKLKIGISDYSHTLSTNQLTKIGLSLKKLLKKDSYSVRIVPNKGATLGSAQIIHNRLTAENGIEFVLYKHQGKLCVATTVHEQDIEAYAARDQARPMRDARVGMLPPKLAQTIINLATGTVTTTTDQTILDPFCGTGVVLQEALLMSYNVIGTDLEPRMITYSEENIAWLHSKYPELPGTTKFAIGDAAQQQWQPTPDFIAAETYLGKPFTAMPSQHELVEVVQSVNTLHKKVLQNIHAQITPKTRICLAVPAWRTKKGFVHLPVLDQLDKLGYNQLVFSHVNAKKFGLRSSRSNCSKTAGGFTETVVSVSAKAICNNNLGDNIICHTLKLVVPVKITMIVPANVLA